MLIGNLPVAGAASVQLHNENKQRVTEFKSLDNALNDGDIPSAKAIVNELLRQNAPNLAQSPQKQRQFGYQQSNLDLLGKALEKGDLDDAKKALSALKNGADAAEAVTSRRGDSDAQADDGSEPPPPPPQEQSKTLGVSLDTLA